MGSGSTQFRFNHRISSCWSCCGGTGTFDSDKGRNGKCCYRGYRVSPRWLTWVYITLPSISWCCWWGDFSAFRSPPQGTLDGEADLQPETCTEWGTHSRSIARYNYDHEAGTESSVIHYIFYPCLCCVVAHCKKTADAPWNDLKLYKHLLQYEMIDRQIADSAIWALNRHLWYLTAEMIPLSLFSESVPLGEHQALANALLGVKPADELQSPQNRFGAGWGKPRFWSIPITALTQQCDLVGVDSWFTIYRLQLDVSFLKLPVNVWKTNAAYMACVDNIAAVNVVNDCAERGVKLSSDFIDTARSDEHFQRVLKVMEDDRKAASIVRHKQGYT